MKKNKNAGETPQPISQLIGELMIGFLISGLVIVVKFIVSMQGFRIYCLNHCWGQQVD